MDQRAAIDAVIGRYDPAFRPRSFTAVAGGLSAGSVWRLETAAGPLCLRAWPPGYAAERVGWIHAAVARAVRGGCALLPAPILTRLGATCESHDGQLWELTPWLPGAADFQDFPSPERLTAAMEGLARVHDALADFREGRLASVELETPAVVDRVRRIAELRRGKRERILAEVIPAAWPELEELRRVWHEHFQKHAEGIEQRLTAALGSVPIAVCLRDIWHDHVLFTSNRVTGIVDLGAMRLDTIATDLARLLGSLVGDDRERWRLGLAAYRAARGLSAEEEQLAGLLDEANVLLTPATWLSWLLVERREFADAEQVRRRIAAAMQRLRPR